MSNHLYKTVALLFALLLTTFSVRAEQPQESHIYGLEKHLTREMAGPEAIQVIKRHLLESAASDPLTDLVAWAKAGFPDLHDEHGIWSTESLSLKLGVVRSIFYYASALPPEVKSDRYLNILRALERDDYISHNLTGMAYLVVDDLVLEAEVRKLLGANAPKLRSQGLMMGHMLVQKKRALFERYIQIVRSDPDPHVRAEVLYAIGGWRNKEVAYLGFERLLNDADQNVRDLGSRLLESAASALVLTDSDLAAILAPISKTTEPFVRIHLARVAARLTTNRSLFIQVEKITDDLVSDFVRRIRLRESEIHSPITKEELAKMWLDWWTPLIPEYSKRIHLIH